MKMNWYPGQAERSLGERVMPYVLILMGLTCQVSTAAMSVLTGLGTLVFLIDMARDRAYVTRGRHARAVGCVFLLFAATLVVAAACSLEPARSFPEAATTLSRMFLFAFALFYVRSWRLATAIVIAFACSALVNDIVAIRQDVLQIPSGLMGNRPTGLVHHPVFLGSFMLMTIPLLSLGALHFPIGRGWRLFLGLCSVTSLAVLFLSLTRGAWLAFLAVMVLTVVLDARHRKTAALCFAALSLVILVLFTQVPTIAARAEQIMDKDFQSNTERVLMWKSALEIFRDHPITGIGQDEFGLVYNRDYISPEAKERSNPGDPRSGHGHPHNNFMKVLSERGFVGITGFLILHGFVIVWLVRTFRRAEDDQASIFALAGILIFVGVQLEGLTDTNLQLAHISRTYWLLMGLCLAAGCIGDSKPRQE